MAVGVKFPFGTNENLNETNVGTVGSYATVSESGDNVYHKTRLSLTGVLPAIAGGADLAVGRLIYTFPAGVIRVLSTVFDNVAITQTEAHITADTPDVGLGTVIASGANALLSATASFENIMTGQTLNNCNGTGEKAGVASTLVLHDADAHTVYFNVADGWAASGDAAAVISGDVVITWEFIG